MITPSGHHCRSFFLASDFTHFINSLPSIIETEVGTEHSLMSTPCSRFLRKWSNLFVRAASPRRLLDIGGYGRNMCKCCHKSTQAIIISSKSLTIYLWHSLSPSLSTPVTRNLTGQAAKAGSAVVKGSPSETPKLSNTYKVQHRSEVDSSPFALLN